MSKKVLFIHHGSYDGGAPLSMLYTMKGLSKHGYLPVAGLRSPSDKLRAIYTDAGFQTIDMPWIPKLMTCAQGEGNPWNPIVWYNVFKASRMWKRAQELTLDLIRKENFHIVHLNSMSLSCPAQMLMKEEIPFVWHVRENGPNHKGLRYKYIQKYLLKAKNVIFLSKAEQKSWVGQSNHGKVINNFVDFSQFQFTEDKSASKSKMNIEPSTKVLLYLGGLKPHKGILTLVDIIKQLKGITSSKFICLMPDSALKNKTPSQFEKKVLDKIEALRLTDECRLLPFNPYITEYFQASDVLVFPANKPHFARPIIEAASMKVPSVSSDLPSIDELVIHDSTGYLVPCNEPKAFAKKIAGLFENQQLSKKMGNHAHKFALDKFEFNRQIDKILAIYKGLDKKQLN